MLDGGYLTIREMIAKREKKAKKKRDMNEVDLSNWIDRSVN